MATSKELQMVCDRLSQAAGEFKAHAVRLAQLEQAVAAKQAELTGLDSKIDQAQGLAAQVDDVHKLLNTKKRELAELELTIRKKHEEHGSIDSDLRGLMKRAAKLAETA